MTVHIIADSAADLPLSYYDEHNITLIPLRVLLGEQEFEDLITIEPKQVFDAMRQGASPKTSQASPNRIKETFVSAAQTHTSAIYVAFFFIRAFRYIPDSCDDGKRSEGRIP
ncbi:hypothetical protein BsIDN1_20460 [Bacillus safensis]|uniref:Fatty acid-binding protein DegV n=1 Tax=Bacillus safensis TaxID=561879 RepID=A0A5S9M6H3_BACIA|nr:hypothetical protein BsIDN1_20460 [Bacillus safensis]